MVTRSQFATWLQTRRDAGETLAAIGERFGVSHVTVGYWISGKRNPSRMTLVLAGELCRTPMEMAAGLPSPQEPSSGACAHLKAIVKKFSNGEPGVWDGHGWVAQ